MGWHFIGIKHMGKIKRNAEILKSYFFYREKRRADIRHETERAWFIRLIFNRNINFWIMLGDFI